MEGDQVPAWADAECDARRHLMGRLVIKESNSTQNGKAISRKVAKLAKKGQVICFVNTGFKDSL